MNAVNGLKILKRRTNAGAGDIIPATGIPFINSGYTSRCSKRCFALRMYVISSPSN